VKRLYTYIITVSKVIGAIVVIASALYGGYRFIFSRGEQKAREEFRFEMSAKNDSLVIKEVRELKKEVSNVREGVDNLNMTVTGINKNVDILLVRDNKLREYMTTTAKSTDELLRIIKIWEVEKEVEKKKNDFEVKTNIEKIK